MTKISGVQATQSIQANLQAAAKNAKAAEKAPDKAAKLMADADKQMQQAAKTVKQAGKDLPKPVLKDFEAAKKAMDLINKDVKAKKAPEAKKLGEIAKVFDKAQKTAATEAKKAK